MLQTIIVQGLVDFAEDYFIEPPDAKDINDADDSRRLDEDHLYGDEINEVLDVEGRLNDLGEQLDRIGDGAFLQRSEPRRAQFDVMRSQIDDPKPTMSSVTRASLRNLAVTTLSTLSNLIEQIKGEEFSEAAGIQAQEEVIRATTSRVTTPSFHFPKSDVVAAKCTQRTDCKYHWDIFAQHTAAFNTCINYFCEFESLSALQGYVDQTHPDKNVIDGILTEDMEELWSLYDALPKVGEEGYGVANWKQTQMLLAANNPKGVFIRLQEFTFRASDFDDTLGHIIITTQDPKSCLFPFRLRIIEAFVSENGERTPITSVQDVQIMATSIPPVRVHGPDIGFDMVDDPINADSVGAIYVITATLQAVILRMGGLFAENKLLLQLDMLVQKFLDRNLANWGDIVAHMEPAVTTVVQASRLAVTNVLLDNEDQQLNHYLAYSNLGKLADSLVLHNGSLASLPDQKVMMWEGSFGVTTFLLYRFNVTTDGLYRFQTGNAIKKHPYPNTEMSPASFVPSIGETNLENDCLTPDQAVLSFYPWPTDPRAGFNYTKTVVTATSYIDLRGCSGGLSAVSAGMEASRVQVIILLPEEHRLAPKPGYGEVEPFRCATWLRGSSYDWNTELCDSKYKKFGADSDSQLDPELKDIQEGSLLCNCDTRVLSGYFIGGQVVPVPAKVDPESTGELPGGRFESMAWLCLLLLCAFVAIFFRARWDDNELMLHHQHAQGSCWNINKDQMGSNEIKQIFPQGVDNDEPPNIGHCFVRMLVIKRPEIYQYLIERDREDRRKVVEKAQERAKKFAANVGKAARRMSATLTHSGSVGLSVEDQKKLQALADANNFDPPGMPALEDYDGPEIDGMDVGENTSRTAGSGTGSRQLELGDSVGNAMPPLIAPPPFEPANAEHKPFCNEPTSPPVGKPKKQQLKKNDPTYGAALPNKIPDKELTPPEPQRVEVQMSHGAMHNEEQSRQDLEDRHAEIKKKLLKTGWKDVRQLQEFGWNIYPDWDHERDRHGLGGWDSAPDQYYFYRVNEETSQWDPPMKSDIVRQNMAKRGQTIDSPSKQRRLQNLQRSFVEDPNKKLGMAGDISGDGPQRGADSPVNTKHGLVPDRDPKVQKTGREKYEKAGAHAAIRDRDAKSPRRDRDTTPPPPMRALELVPTEREKKRESQEKKRKDRSKTPPGGATEIVLAGANRQLQVYEKERQLAKREQAMNARQLAVAQPPSSKPRRPKTQRERDDEEGMMMQADDFLQGPWNQEYDVQDRLDWVSWYGWMIYMRVLHSTFFFFERFF